MYRWIYGREFSFMVVLWRHVRRDVKRDFGKYIKRYTSQNEKQINIAIPMLMY